MKLRYVAPLAIAASAAAIGLAPIAAADEPCSRARAMPKSLLPPAPLATGRPTAAAIRRGYGRPAVPPLTTTVRLGREPLTPPYALWA